MHLKHIIKGLIREFKNLNSGAILNAKYNLRQYKLPKINFFFYMAANSKLRNLIKRNLIRILPSRYYGIIQSLAVSYDLLFFGYREEELRAIRFLIEPGNVVLDVGANFGQWSVTLSKYVREAGVVYAFEPVPYTHNVLKLVCRIFRASNVNFILAAASDKAGVGEISVPVSIHGTLSTGQAYLGGTSIEQPTRDGDKNNLEKIPVEKISLDSLLHEKLGEISFIKIDVEGAELEVLRGARQIILASRPTIICEINPHFMVRIGAAPKDIYEFLGEVNYRLCIISTRGFDHSLEDFKGPLIERNYALVPIEKYNSIKQAIERRSN